MADIIDFRGRQGSGVSAEIEDIAFAVIGAAIEVHRELGPGLAESHYKKAMSQELKLRGILHAIEVEVDVIYKGEPVGKTRIDLLVGDVLIVELKALEVLSPVHRSPGADVPQTEKTSAGIVDQLQHRDSARRNKTGDQHIN